MAQDTNLSTGNAIEANENTSENLPSNPPSLLKKFLLCMGLVVPTLFLLFSPFVVDMTGMFFTSTSEYVSQEKPDVDKAAEGEQVKSKEITNENRSGLWLALPILGSLGIIGWFRQRSCSKRGTRSRLGAINQTATFIVVVLWILGLFLAFLTGIGLYFALSAKNSESLNDIHLLFIFLFFGIEVLFLCWGYVVGYVGGICLEFFGKRKE